MRVSCEGVEWTGSPGSTDRSQLIFRFKPPPPAVRAVDAIVICNILTSAILEASLWGKPVFVQSQSMIWYRAAEWATER